MMRPDFACSELATLWNCTTLTPFLQGPEVALD